MEEFINNIISYLLPQNDFFLYIFLFLSAVIENLFPPIPGDTITALGAFLVGTGRLDYTLVYLSTTTGSVAGFMCLFLIGKFLGRKFFIEKNYRMFSADSIHSAEQWFEKYGYYIVLSNRFFPGIRSVISIVSGISGLTTMKVLLLAMISSSIWNLIWIHTGFVLGNNWEVVKARMGVILRNYNIGVVVVLSVLIIGYLLFKRLKKRNSDAG